MTSLANAELTAFGWYTYYSQQCNKVLSCRQHATHNTRHRTRTRTYAVSWGVGGAQTQKPEVCARVALAASVAGTDLGLSKVPYLRESRRSIGIHNFRLMWENMTSQYVPQPARHLHRHRLRHKNQLAIAGAWV